MILVTGATGNVGRNVVLQLLEAGETVRALTRDPEKAAFPAEVEVVAGDIADPQSLPPALKGVDRAFLFPVFGQLDGFLDVAKASGVEHIAMLSSSAIEFDDPGFIGQVHLECENAVTGSGIPRTFVRAGLFMLNDRGWAPQIRATGVVRTAYGTAAAAPVDERDIAAVATASLLDPRDGSVHSLTGPESLTQIDRVRIIGEVLGKPVAFEELSREEALSHLVQQMPPDAAEFLLDQLASWQGVTAEVLPTVEQVTGRPAHTYAQWVEHHVADFS
ncbi:NmrA family NAD(P)-binding protein [Streptomyces sp. enrichment culture]|uniref:NmrA family NAD(P)-binding protein n=1 Tax=Streptomyces sp. enrichment culture TaxID=1795815 RepID=UPI003F54D1D0